MKIAIQGHPARGKEVIQILESLGGNNGYDQSGSNEEFVYFINSVGLINSVRLQMCSNERRIYTLEEFEKEFPFKVGDKVIDYEGDVAIITGFAYIEENLGYSLQYENGRGTATPRILTLYKEMKEERNITLTLDKAKEWYKKGGELKEIALQAFTEKELNPLPKSWEEFCERYPVKGGECWLDSHDRISMCTSSYEGNRIFKNWIPSKKSAEAHLAMIQLEQLRDCWRQGWKPDWLDGNTKKYTIKGWRDKNSIEITYVTSAFLSFPTYELAEEFLKCFRDLIEKAGDLI